MMALLACGPDGRDQCVHHHLPFYSKTLSSGSVAELASEHLKPNDFIYVSGSLGSYTKPDASGIRQLYYKTTSGFGFQEQASPFIVCDFRGSTFVMAGVTAAKLLPTVGVAVLETTAVRARYVSNSGGFETGAK
ncbi:hypothetical protein E2542_SST21894 [Spatholobus suberectus]|nr:hypothetical protein E2542_SST21894 [Spatholobus suberectus]